MISPRVYFAPLWKALAAATTVAHVGAQLVEQREVPSHGVVGQDHCLDPEEPLGIVGLLPQLRVGESDDGIHLERLIQHVAAHHLPQDLQDVIQVVDKSLAAAPVVNVHLGQDHCALQRVQLTAEQDPGMVLHHQHISHQVGHMLGLLHVEGAGLIVHELRLYRRRRRRRRGRGCGRCHGHLGHGRHLCGDDPGSGLLSLLDDLDLAGLQILPGRRGEDLACRYDVAFGICCPKFAPKSVLRDTFQALHPLRR